MRAYQVAHGYEDLRATYSMRMSPVVQHLHLRVYPCLLRPTHAVCPVLHKRWGSRHSDILCLALCKAASLCAHEGQEDVSPPPLRSANRLPQCHACAQRMGTPWTLALQRSTLLKMRGLEPWSPAKAQSLLYWVACNAASIMTEGMALVWVIRGQGLVAEAPPIGLRAPHAIFPPAHQKAHRAESGCSNPFL